MLLFVFSYIHGNRLVHMDIKPENIFLSQGETSAHSSINTSGDDLSSDSKSPKDQDKCVVVPSNLNVSSSSSSITPIPSADNNDDDRIHDVADHHSISDAAVASTSSPADKGLRQSTPIEEEPAATAGKSAAVDVASAVPTSVACSSPRPSQLISMSSPKMTPVMKQKAAGERSLPPLPKFLFQSPKNNKLITSIGKKTPIRALQSTPKHMSHGAAQLMSHHSPRGGSAGVELMQHSPRPGSSTSSVSLPQLRTPGGGNDSSKVWDDSTDSGMQSSEGGKTSSPLNE